MGSGSLVRASTTAGMEPSTIVRIRPASSLVKGWGASAMRSSGTPKTLALQWASSTKRFAVHDTVGTPRRSSSAISRMSQEVQLPQSAVVPTAASTRDAVSSSRSAEARRMCVPWSPKTSMNAAVG